MYFWELSWKVTDIGSVKRAWDSSSILSRLIEEKRVTFFDELDKYVNQGFLVPRC